jgi:hypothetical protein
MSQSEPGDRLEWSVFPFKERPGRAAIVTGVIGAVAVLVYLAFKDVFLVILSVAILFASLHTFFNRTTYLLDGDGVTVRTMSVKNFKEWSYFKSFYPDGKGVTLSPFDKPSRLEPFRSVRLLYGGNRDEVVAFVSKRFSGDARRSA